MRDITLPSPGLLAKSYDLRRTAASSISSVEVAAARTPGGKTQAAGTLQAFFTACATSLNGLVDVVLPTISSRVAASATTVNMTFSKPMDQTVIPALSAFTSAGNTITAAAWTSATVLQFTGTGFAAAENFTYTQPAVSYLRDLAGNAVATSSANLT